MKSINKKRAVLFLLFIFPLICFLLLSTGINNFTKLPILSKNVTDISTIDSSKTMRDKISIVCFLGNDFKKAKTGIFNLNIKIYKEFIDHKNFRVIAIYPKSKKREVAALKKQIGAYSDIKNWRFIEGSKRRIEHFYANLKTKDSLQNLFINKAYIIDKALNLRGRIIKENNKKIKLYGYNIFSISELNNELKDDIKVLYYEYYAAFKTKNKNKADRKKFEL